MPILLVNDEVENKWKDLEVPTHLTNEIRIRYIGMGKAVLEQKMEDKTNSLVEYWRPVPFTKEI